MIKSWLEALRVYRDRRVLSILTLGFSSGLPLLLTFSTLSTWLATEGVSKTSIGLFAAVGVPYSFKFLWSPLIDGLRPPLFGRLGQRRGWMACIQLLLMAAVVGLGSLTPKDQPLLTALLALCVAFLSASQDIVIDAYRVEILKPEQQGAGATMVQIGYRLGMLVAGAGALYVADAFGWHVAYLVMALLVTVGIATILAGSEPAGREEKRQERMRQADWLEDRRRPEKRLDPHLTTPLRGSLPLRPRGGEGQGEVGRVTNLRWLAIRAWLRDHVMAPFADFMGRPAWLVILLFILLYKLADVVAGVMASPLYIDLGFSLSEIASVSKIFGFFATLLGAFLGGLMVTRMGLFPSLLICGIAQSAANLMYALQAIAGHDVAMLALTIATENITAGMGSAALVAYLSGLCSVGYTATQYALLSSLAAVGRTLLSTPSGWLKDQMDWVSFFAASAFLGAPGIVVLLWLARRQRLAEAKESAE